MDELQITDKLIKVIGQEDISAELGFLYSSEKHLLLIFFLIPVLFLEEPFSKPQLNQTDSLVRLMQKPLNLKCHIYYKICIFSFLFFLSLQHLSSSFLPLSLKLCIPLLSQKYTGWVPASFLHNNHNFCISILQFHISYVALILQAQQLVKFLFCPLGT